MNSASSGNQSSEFGVGPSVALGAAIAANLRADRALMSDTKLFAGQGSESDSTRSGCGKQDPVPELSVDLAGVRLQNPLIPASGCFGFGEEFLDFFDPNILGAAALKGTTREPREGNPTPRIAETPSGMINSIGLQNPGIDVVVAERLPALAKFYHQPVIMNVSGFSIDEYVECCEKADGLSEFIELNISCPNVHGGGMSFGASCAAASEVTREVRQVVKESKLFVKLSPNVTDVVEIAQGCVDAGADGLTLINTLLGMRIDVKRRCPVIAQSIGGFSGPAILPVALRMVYQVAQTLAVPIMGSGGIATAHDVVEMMMAGASAVQIGAESLRNPLVIPQILEQLPEVMAELGITNLQEIIGVAKQ
ncbi:dihydroorotate dehydrogenase [Actinomycetaceae bacterium MB13-C1-2]|nr:dihydroorotate dehydrogenase [Actinomycetaceae bacterium MB13-C1-2]